MNPCGFTKQIGKYCMAKPMVTLDEMTTCGAECMVM